MKLRTICCLPRDYLETEHKPGNAAAQVILAGKAQNT